MNLIDMKNWIKRNINYILVNLILFRLIYVLRNEFFYILKLIPFKAYKYLLLFGLSLVAIPFLLGIIDRMEYLVEIIPLKVERFILDFGKREVLVLERFFILIMILPIYCFMWLMYKFLISFWNKYPRAIFSDYTITRKDTYFLNLGLMSLGVATILFLISLELETLYKFIDFILYRFEVNFDYQVYLNKAYQFYTVIKSWFIKIGLITAIFVVLDENLIKKAKKIDIDRPGSKLRRWFWRRLALKTDRIFIGITRDKKREPFLVDAKQFDGSHLQGMATTGGGKTELFYSLAFQWMKKDRGIIVMDFKGDLTFAKKLYTAYKRRCPNNNQQFKVINLGNPSLSNSYNFLLRGNALEIKDRLVDSLDWGEGDARYYKNYTVKILLVFLRAVVDHLNKLITPKDLYLLFKRKEAVEILRNMVTDDDLKKELDYILKNFEEVSDKCDGLTNQIDPFCNDKDGIADIVNTYEPEIDFYESYKQNDIIYITIPDKLKETGQAFGKMILSDMETTSSYIRDNIPRKERSITHFIVDEFGSVAKESFTTALEKFRDSNIPIGLFFQSKGHLDKVSDSFATIVTDNTNLGIYGLVNDADTAEEVAKRIGTKKSSKETTRVEKDLLRQKEGEVGSYREVDEFIVSPNTIKNFKVGQFVFLGKRPDNFCRIVNTDYWEDPEDFEELDFLKKEIKTKSIPDERKLNMAKLIKENSKDHGSFTDSTQNKVKDSLDEEQENKEALSSKVRNKDEKQHQKKETDNDNQEEIAGKREQDNTKQHEKLKEEKSPKNKGIGYNI